MDDIEIILKDSSSHKKKVFLKRLHGYHGLLEFIYEGHRKQNITTFLPYEFKLVLSCLKANCEGWQRFKYSRTVFVQRWESGWMITLQT